MAHILTASAQNIAFAVGGVIFWRHLKDNRRVYAEAPIEDTSSVKKKEKKKAHKEKKREKVNVDESSLVLKQVQVIFRHGARTPIHTIPNLLPVSYAPDMVINQHQATIFPYERISFINGRRTEYGGYQKQLEKEPLRGGAPCGALTGLGQDQMYMLGQRLKQDYKDRLDLQNYDPNSVFTISTNIQRTVESARCVLAGIYGKEHLTKYANNGKKVTINVLDSKTGHSGLNYLIPDTMNCPALRTINHAAMRYADNIPKFKKDRKTVEDHIESHQQELLDEIDAAQSKLQACYERGDHVVKMKDQFQTKKIEDLATARNEATEKVANFWADVMARHPELSKVLKPSDMKALVYLKKIYVEDNIKPPFRRYIFKFDSNPYFYNQEIVKVVKPDILSTSSTKIKWKPFGTDLLNEKINLSDYYKKVAECEAEAKKKKFKTIRKTFAERFESYKLEHIVRHSDLLSRSMNEMEADTDWRQDSPVNTSNEQPVPDMAEVKDEKEEEISLPNSFFEWLSFPVMEEDDDIGSIIRNDINWDPVRFFKMESQNQKLDTQHSKLNFVFARDDLVARWTHGFPLPVELEPFGKMISENATTLLFYAMTGQDKKERQLVTRLSVGPLMANFYRQAKRKVKEDKDAFKMCLYSAHDSTLAALLEAMGVWNNEWPPYGSDVRLELYQNQNKDEYYVKALYNGEPQILRDQDGHLIPWKHFKKFVEPLMIDSKEYREICFSTDIVKQLSKDKPLDPSEKEEKETEEAAKTPAGM